MGKGATYTVRCAKCSKMINENRSGLCLECGARPCKHCKEKFEHPRMDILTCKKKECKLKEAEFKRRKKLGMEF
jgi:hypothetical protein